MRSLAACIVLVAACDAEVAAPTRPPPAPSAVAAARERKDCRDACEQNAIVAGRGDAEIRACRARCDGAAGETAPAHEAPSKITVAPPVHAPPNVRPTRAPR